MAVGKNLNLQELFEAMEPGPACPMCWRTSGHGLGCPVERYVRELREHQRAEAEKMAEIIWPSPEHDLAVREDSMRPPDGFE